MRGNLLKFKKLRSAVDNGEQIGLGEKMLFNSYIFIFLFLPVALLGWYVLNYREKYRAAQGFLVLMSLWFYGYFNVSYLFIIIGSCLINYLFSLLLTHKKRPEKSVFLLAAGCILNLGVLGYFKYYDFFIENINVVFGADFSLKHILLPLGISFFTFQQLSFVIDRCLDRAPHYGLLDYLTFVTFFPQLIAGPIVLHSEMIPQFQDWENRRYSSENFAKGLSRFVLGLGKKVLLADHLAMAVNFAFAGVESLDSLSALTAALFFTLEIYFDFSGYCDMAVGLGRMFGIHIPENFDAPYASVSVKEFWRRWHITLGRFLMTYVYFPLGGSRKGKARTAVNTMAVFFLSGLWHGANWTFVLWGVLHGAAVAWNSLEVVKIKNKYIGRALTFAFVCAAFVFFRSDTIQDGCALFGRIFSFSWNGSIFQMAEAVKISEIYIVTKALSMKAQWLLPYVNAGLLAVLTLVSFAALAGKKAALTAEESSYEAGFSWKITVLFVWSVLSFSGVSTFLYFNF